MSSRKKNKEKSLVIVGARGFKGQELLRLFENHPQYKNVIAIDYKKPPIPLKKVKFIKLDLTETLADATLAQILKDEPLSVTSMELLVIVPKEN